MKRILFICLGNICRSPMAEFVLKKMLCDAGRADDYLVASAATSGENVFRGVGAPVYPPAKAALARRGIDCSGKRARQVQPEDYDAYDLIVCMDDANVRSTARIVGGDPQHKIVKLMDFTDHPGNVADPWYTGDFETAYSDIEAGCRALLKQEGVLL